MELASKTILLAALITLSDAASAQITLRLDIRQ
jgi:hypothetical protein